MEKNEMTKINEFFKKNKCFLSILNQRFVKNFISIKELQHIFKQLQYIKSGSTGHVFKTNINGLDLALKIIVYNKRDWYSEYTNPKRPENAELLMLKYLSYFVLNKQVPHFILPLTSFYTNINYILGLKEPKMVEKQMMINKQKQSKECYDTISITISEWADSGDLLDYLKNNYTTIKIRQWRAIFFQLLITLANIFAKYPNFRHNDLKANNILLQNTPIIKENEMVQYELNGYKFISPNIGFMIKIWDFDFSCIPSIIDNEKVDSKWTNIINIKPERNQYYDIHYFINSLFKDGFLPDLLDNQFVPNEVKEFIKRLVPDRYRLTHKMEITKKVIKFIKNVMQTKFDKIFEKYETIPKKDFLNILAQNMSDKIVIQDEIANKKDFLEELNESLDDIIEIKDRYISETGRLLLNIELITPIEILLTDPFFKKNRLF